METRLGPTARSRCFGVGRGGLPMVCAGCAETQWQTRSVSDDNLHGCPVAVRHLPRGQLPYRGYKTISAYSSEVTLRQPPPPPPKASKEIRDRRKPTAVVGCGTFRSHSQFIKVHEKDMALDNACPAILYGTPPPLSRGSAECLSGHCCTHGAGMFSHCLCSYFRITDILRRGLRWCKNYQATLDLKEGTFSTSLRSLKLADFGASLTAGRNVQAYFSDAEIRTDPVLCDVMMENALDNARKHGHPTDPDIRCSIVLSTDPNVSHDPKRPSLPSWASFGSMSSKSSKSSTPTVTFKVSNRMDPADAKLSDNIVQEVMTSYKRKSVGGLSDGLGLKHCFLAASALGMRFDFRQQRDVVTFSASMEASIVPPTVVQDPIVSFRRDVSEFPAGLKVCHRRAAPGPSLHAATGGMAGDWASRMMLL